jgi:hypothetical protein
MRTDSQWVHFPPGNWVALAGSYRSGGRAQVLGAARLGSLAADSAAGPVGRPGRWAGTTAVAEAPGSFETKQQCGTSTVSREGHPLIIRDPIDPHRADRWDRAFVTKEALCRADPDPWEPWGSNPLGPPGRFPSSKPPPARHARRTPDGRPLERPIDPVKTWIECPHLQPSGRRTLWGGKPYLEWTGGQSLRIERVPPLGVHGCSKHLTLILGHKLNCAC